MKLLSRGRLPQSYQVEFLRKSHDPGMRLAGIPSSAKTYKNTIFSRWIFFLNTFAWFCLLFFWLRNLIGRFKFDSTEHACHEQCMFFDTSKMHREDKIRWRPNSINLILLTSTKRYTLHKVSNLCKCPYPTAYHFLLKIFISKVMRSQCYKILIRRCQSRQKQGK